MPREDRPEFARFLRRILGKSSALEDARACLQHYADEIREYIEDSGCAPLNLDRYTCGADYRHEAKIDPTLVRVAVQRINAIAHVFRFRPELREAIDLVISNL